MAMYEYQCEACSKKFDLMRKVVERDSEAVCPSCNKLGKRIVWQRVSVLQDAAPNAAFGDGEPEDFLGEDYSLDDLDDFDGLDF